MKRYCHPQCHDPFFNECADCWQSGGNPALGVTRQVVSCSECGAVTLPGEPPIHNRTCLHRLRRPDEERERRALRWLMDVRENGGPLDRGYARTVIETLAYFEQEVPVDTRP